MTGKKRGVVAPVYLVSGKPHAAARPSGKPPPPWSPSQERARLGRQGKCGWLRCNAWRSDDSPYCLRHESEKAEEHRRREATEALSELTGRPRDVINWLLLHHHSRTWLAESCGVAESSINAWLYEYVIPTDINACKVRALTGLTISTWCYDTVELIPLELRRQVCAGYAVGLNQKELVTKFGLSHRAVRKVLVAGGIAFRSPGRPLAKGRI